MKAIILSLAGESILFCVVTVRFRLSPTSDRAAVLLKTFFAILPLVVLGFLLSPPDLAFLPDPLTVHVVWIDLVFLLFLYSAGFFGGVLQLYNLADRGFSLRILIDILESPEGHVTLDQVMQGYGAGRGMTWMYDKRIEGMVRTGLLTVDGDRLILTARGVRAAGIFNWLQGLLRIPQVN